MQWSEICEDGHLHDLPYKIELNEWGNIVMSPASNRHGRYQALLIRLISQMKTDGDIIAECSVKTGKGTKVADVAWLSDAFIEEYGFKTPYDECPELVIEIKSPSNSYTELEEKADLYFARGASEVWICDEEGNIKVYSKGLEKDKSAIIAGFEKQIG